MVFSMVEFGMTDTSVVCGVNIYDMNIKNFNKFFQDFKRLGTKDSIKSICERYDIVNYTINEDGSIDVDGEVYLSGRGLTKLPLKFRRVTGGFFICYNKLTSLEGSPKEVGGSFDCQNNQLTSLKGCPKSVGGSFECYKNQLTSLEGSPKSVGGSFYCSWNKLTNLVGGPEVVLGPYYAYDNQINSFEGFPDDYEGGYVDFTKNPVQEVLKQFPKHLLVRTIHLINDYDAIWNGEVIEERLEMVKEKLGLIN
jgi:hypothetical protein